MRDELEALKAAVDLVGSQSALARLIGGKVKQAHVWNWLNMQKRVPAEHVLAIEQAVAKKISRYELRPDIYGTEPPLPVVERRQGPSDRRGTIGPARIPVPSDAARRTTPRER